MKNIINQWKYNHKIYSISNLVVNKYLQIFEEIDINFNGYLNLKQIEDYLKLKINFQKTKKVINYDFYDFLKNLPPHLHSLDVF